jgi:single-strand DNA-binding protein
MNQVVLMGRLTRDPELRHTQSGIAVASFALAVDRGFAAKDGGERQTDFIDIVAWRNTAEFVTKYFIKGQMAAVTGRLQIRDYTDKDGNKRKAAEVVADNVYFTESKKSRDGGGNSSPADKGGYNGGFQTPVTGSDFAELEDDDGDLPF